MEDKEDTNNILRELVGEATEDNHNNEGDEDG